jgi:hypothetical protein
MSGGASAEFGDVRNGRRSAAATFSIPGMVRHRLMGCW